MSKFTSKDKELLDIVDRRIRRTIPSYVTKELKEPIVDQVLNTLDTRIDTAISTAFDNASFYTEAEIDAKEAALNNSISDLNQFVVDNYYTQTVIEERDAALEAGIQATIDGLDYYTTLEVDAKDAALQQTIDNLDFYGTAHVDAVETSLNQSITAVEQDLLNNYYTQTAIQEREAALEDSIQQTINNLDYYTTEEVDDKNAAVQDAVELYTRNYVSETDLKDVNNKLSGVLDGKVTFDESYNDVVINKANGIVVTGKTTEEVPISRINLRGDGTTDTGDSIAGIHIQKNLTPENTDPTWKSTFWANKHGDLFLKGNVQLDDGSIITGTPTEGVFVHPTLGLLVSSEANGVRAILNASGSSAEDGIDVDYSGFAIQKDVQTDSTLDPIWESQFFVDSSGNVVMKGTLQPGSIIAGTVKDGVTIDPDLGILVASDNVRTVINSTSANNPDGDDTFAGITIQRNISETTTPNWKSKFFVDGDGNVVLEGILQAGTILTGDPLNDSITIDEDLGVLVKSTTSRVVLASKTLTGTINGFDNVNYSGISIQENVATEGEEDDWRLNFYADPQGNVFLKGSIEMEAGSLITGTPDEGVVVDNEIGLVVSSLSNGVRAILNASGSSNQEGIDVDYAGFNIQKNTGTTEEPDWKSQFYVDQDGNVIMKGTLQPGSIIAGSVSDGVIIDPDLGLLVTSANVRTVINSTSANDPNADVSYAGITVQANTQEDPLLDPVWKSKFFTDEDGNVFLDGILQAGTILTGDPTDESIIIDEDFGILVQSQISRVALTAKTNSGTFNGEDLVDYSGISIQENIALQGEPDNWRLNFYASPEGNVFLRGNVQLEDGSILVGSEANPKVFISNELSAVVTTSATTRTFLGGNSNEISGLVIQKNIQTDPLLDPIWQSNFFVNNEGDIVTRGTFNIDGGNIFDTILMGDPVTVAIGPNASVPDINQYGASFTPTNISLTLGGSTQSDSESTTYKTKEKENVTIVCFYDFSGFNSDGTNFNTYISSVSIQLIGKKGTSDPEVISQNTYVTIDNSVTNEYLIGNTFDYDEIALRVILQRKRTAPTSSTINVENIKINQQSSSIGLTSDGLYQRISDTQIVPYGTGGSGAPITIDGVSASDWSIIENKPFETVGNGLKTTGDSLQLDFTEFTTNDITEGVNNLYYTQVRFDSAFSAKSTTNLTEGSNLYYTDTRVRSAVSSSGDIAYNQSTGIFSFSEYISTNAELFSEIGITTAERDQLATINTVTINNTQWGYLGELDQPLKTTDNVSFENITAKGNLTVLGTEFIANTETVEIEDNLGVINANETGNGITAGFAGWRVDRGTADDFLFGFQESNGAFSVGKDSIDGTLQAIATRENDPNDTALAFWNSSDSRFDTSNNVTFNGTNLILAIQATEVSHAVRAGRIFTAGNGLTGGGDLTNDRTITLGTPSTIGISTSNNSTANSHTHTLDLSGRTLTAGNGLTGLGNLGADRTVTLGTPSTITVETTDSTTPTSHTHLLDLSGRTLNFVGGNGISVDNSLQNIDANRTWNLSIDINDPLYFNVGSIDIYNHGFNQRGVITTEAQEIYGSKTIMADMIMGSTAPSIRTNHYQSELVGYQITHEGQMDMRYIFTDELRAKAFTADVTQALFGSDILTKSGGELAESVTLPAIGQSVEITIFDLEGFKGFRNFENGDYIRLRPVDLGDPSNPNSGAVIGDAWGTVEFVGFTTDEFDVPNGKQKWTLTIEHLGFADSEGMVVQAGSWILDYGVSGDGFIDRSAIGVGTPYDRIVTWTDRPWKREKYILQTHIGNLGRTEGYISEEYIEYRDQVEENGGEIVNEIATRKDFNNENPLDIFGAYFKDQFLLSLAGGDMIIGKNAGGVSNDGIWLNKDNYWYSNNNFSIGGTTGIQFDGTTVFIGSNVDIQANDQFSVVVGNVSSIQAAIDDADTGLEANAQAIIQLDTELSDEIAQATLDLETKILTETGATTLSNLALESFVTSTANSATASLKTEILTDTGATTLSQLSLRSFSTSEAERTSAELKSEILTNTGATLLSQLALESFATTEAQNATANLKTEILNDTGALTLSDLSLESFATNEAQSATASLKAEILNDTGALTLANLALESFATNEANSATATLESKILTETGALALADLSLESFSTSEAERTKAELKAEIIGDTGATTLSDLALESYADTASQNATAELKTEILTDTGALNLSQLSLESFSTSEAERTKAELRTEIITNTGATALSDLALESFVTTQAQSATADLKTEILNETGATLLNQLSLKSFATDEANRVTGELKTEILTSTGALILSELALTGYVDDEISTASTTLNARIDSNENAIGSNVTAIAGLNASVESLDSTRKYTPQALEYVEQVLSNGGEIVDYEKVNQDFNNEFPDSVLVGGFLETRANISVLAEATSGNNTAIAGLTANVEIIEGEVTTINAQTVLKAQTNVDGETTLAEVRLDASSSTGSEITLRSDTFNFQATGNGDFWKTEDNSFQLGGNNGIKYSGAGNVTIGSSTVIQGDLDAVGGTFIGTLSGVDGEFSGVLSGSTGTFGDVRLNDNGISSVGNNGYSLGTSGLTATKGIIGGWNINSNTLCTFIDQSSYLTLSNITTGDKSQSLGLSYFRSSGATNSNELRLFRLGQIGNINDNQQTNRYGLQVGIGNNLTYRDIINISDSDSLIAGARIDEESFWSVNNNKELGGNGVLINWNEESVSFGDRFIYQDGIAEINNLSAKLIKFKSGNSETEIIGNGVSTTQDGDITYTRYSKSTVYGGGGIESITLFENAIPHSVYSVHIKIATVEDNNYSNGYFVANYTTDGTGNKQTDHIEEIFKRNAGITMNNPTILTNGDIQIQSATNARKISYTVEVHRATKDGTSQPTPSAPSITTACKSDDNLNLEWSSVTGATSYELQRKRDTEPTSAYQTISSTSQTSYQDSTPWLQPSVTYNYRVRGVNNQNVGGSWSGTTTTSYNGATAC